MKKLQNPLEGGKYYHVFNRGNNLFNKPDNYRFFLYRLDKYMSVFVDVHAFCLLPKHFHLLVYVLNREVLHLQDAKPVKDPVSHAFHRLFTNYSKAMNKQEKRHGSLLENPFKRKEVIDENYFTNLVFYIHANPQLHGICEDFRMYPWSSYERILSGRQSKLKKKEVLAWFHDQENYVEYHDSKTDMEKMRELIIE